MKLSTFALSSLLATTISATAQTASTTTIATKQHHTQIIKTTQTPEPIKTTSMQQNRDSTVKHLKRHYCPSCGRG
jgi:hypothetical protein